MEENKFAQTEQFLLYAKRYSSNYRNLDDLETTLSKVLSEMLEVIKSQQVEINEQRSTIVDLKKEIEDHGNRIWQSEYDFRNLNINEE